MGPILIKQFNPQAIETATKYFLTQATASLLLLLSSFSHVRLCATP